MTGALLDPLSEWASLLMSSLADAGLTNLVVSPGSRSTPFVLAAAREKRLTLHDVIDERAAAFFALGRTRASRRPAGLLCTSGTAPAHWFPAVVEAARAFLPLVLLTADRPPELQECCAAQTVDQVKLFGDHVRLFLDSGLPDAAPHALRGLRRMAAQLVMTAQHPTPGPVHLNLRARKPLEPRPASSEEDFAFALAARSVAGRGAPVVIALPAAPSQESLHAVAAAIAKSSRGLIVAGATGNERPGAPVLTRFSQLTGFPLLCDATSGLRSAETGALASSDLLLSSPALADAGPDCIVQLGPAPVTSGWDRLCSASSVEAHIVIAAHGWQDPANSASHLVRGPIEAALDGLCSLLASRTPPGSHWRRSIAAVDGAVQQETALLLEDRRLSEGAVARLLSTNLAPGTLLVVGNSLPIRLVEAWGGLVAPGVEVLVQRGANGIDGLIAGAAGAASSGRPAVLLLGDVSAAHDLAALALARSQPVKIVVLNNGGGRIFEQLPLARAGVGAAEMAYFLTPPGIDFAAAALAFGIRFARPSTLAALAEELASQGPELIEIVVPPTEAIEMRAELQRRADAAVRSVFA